MNEKISRNDNCPCGSGKKYKKCCLLNTPIVPSEIVDFEWRKLRKIEGHVIDQHLIPYAMRELPKAVGDAALVDCYFKQFSDEADRELLFNNFFIPWFLFNWIPFDDFGVKDFDPEQTIAQNYVRVHETKLNSTDRCFIEAMNKTYYSFYNVLEIELDKSLTVKDVLLGSTHKLKEKQGTYQLKRGDMVFGRILTLDNQSIFIGMAPFMIPIRYHSDFLDFRDWLIEENNNLALTGNDLREYFDMTLLDYFFEIIINPLIQHYQY